MVGEGGYLGSRLDWGKGGGVTTAGEGGEGEWRDWGAGGGRVDVGNCHDEGGGPGGGASILRAAAHRFEVARHHPPPPPAQQVKEEVSLILEHRAKVMASGASKSEIFLYNDPMNKKQRVERVLWQVFEMSKKDANTVMMRAHRTGKASCGVFDNEEAERLHADMAKEDVLSEVVRVMEDDANAEV